MPIPGYNDFKIGAANLNRIMRGVNLVWERVTEVPFEFTTSWSFQDTGMLAGGHDGSTRAYSDSSIPTGALWTLTNSGYGLRASFEDSANCGGSNALVQSGIATSQISTNEDVLLFLNWEGLGEAEAAAFERMTLFIDNIEVGNAHAPGGGGGCGMGPVVGYNEYPNGYLLTSGTHELRIETSTVDNLYHTGAYYQFAISHQLP